MIIQSLPFPAFPSLVAATPAYVSSISKDLGNDSGGGADLVFTWPDLSELADEIDAGTVIAVVHTTANNAFGTPYSHNIPAGFNSIHEGVCKDSCRHMMAYRRLDGTETGTLTCSKTAGAVGWSHAGTLSIWRDCRPTGTPYEGLSIVNGVEAPNINTGEITTTGPYRRVVSFMTFDGNMAATAANNWASQYAYGTNQGDNTNSGHQCLVRDVLSPATIPVTTHIKAHSRAGSVTIALLPAIEGPALRYKTAQISTSIPSPVVPESYAIGTRVFSLVGGTLPPGLTLDTATGALTGTPTTPGVYPGIQIRMTSDDTPIVCEAFTLTVETGFRYWMLEPTTTGRYMGCSTLKLIDGGGIDRALASNGALASAIGYGTHGSYPITQINDGNDATFTTSTAGVSGAGKGYQIDLGANHDIDKLGFRTRSDTYGNQEDWIAANVKAKFNASDDWTLITTIATGEWGNNEYREFNL